MTRLALLAAFLALAAAPAFAQEAQCFQNEQFLVIGQQKPDEVGSTFRVRAPAMGKIICEYREREGDMLIAESLGLWALFSGARSRFEDL